MNSVLLEFLKPEKMSIYCCVLHILIEYFRLYSSTSNRMLEVALSQLKRHRNAIKNASARGSSSFAKLHNELKTFHEFRKIKICKAPEKMCLPPL